VKFHSLKLDSAPKILESLLLLKLCKLNSIALNRNESNQVKIQLIIIFAIPCMRNSLNVNSLEVLCAHNRKKKKETVLVVNRNVTHIHSYRQT